MKKNLYVFFTITLTTLLNACASNGVHELQYYRGDRLPLSKTAVVKGPGDVSIQYINGDRMMTCGFVKCIEGYELHLLPGRYYLQVSFSRTMHADYSGSYSVGSEPLVLTTVVEAGKQYEIKAVIDNNMASATRTSEVKISIEEVLPNSPTSFR